MAMLNLDWPTEWKKKQNLNSQPYVEKMVICLSNNDDDCNVLVKEKKHPWQDANIKKKDPIKLYEQQRKRDQAGQAGVQAIASVHVFSEELGFGKQFIFNWAFNCHLT